MTSFRKLLLSCTAFAGLTGLTLLPTSAMAQTVGTCYPVCYGVNGGKPCVQVCTSGDPTPIPYTPPQPGPNLPPCTYVGHCGSPPPVSPPPGSPPPPPPPNSPPPSVPQPCNITLCPPGTATIPPNYDFPPFGFNVLDGGTCPTGTYCAAAPPTIPIGSATEGPPWVGYTVTCTAAVQEAGTCTNAPTGP